MTNIFDREYPVATPLDALVEAWRICEVQRQKILADPRDPSWTEHLAEVQSALDLLSLRLGATRRLSTIYFDAIHGPAAFSGFKPT